MSACCHLVPPVVCCATATAVLIWAEYRERYGIKCTAKMLASLSFIALAVLGGASDSTYGQLILVGLVFGAVGDAALLGTSKPAFVAGMAAFGAGHIAYLAAFRTFVAPSEWFGWWALIPYGLAAAVLRWLWPHLGRLRLPVTGYVAFLSTTVVAAWACRFTGDMPDAPATRLAFGAMLFFLSDFTVARQDFVTKSFANKAIGLPLYFSGQLLIASSVL